MEVVQRLASKSEIEKLVALIIQDEWEAILRYPYSPPGVEGLAEGKESYFVRATEEKHRMIGQYVLVTEVVKSDFAVYTMQLSYYNLSEATEPEGVCDIIAVRFMKLGDQYQMLKHDDSSFDISDDIANVSELRNQKGTGYKSKKGVGRPSVPTEEAILKAHEVIYLINQEHDTISEACKKVGISRPTYYKAAKWITDNVPIYSNTKIK